MSAAVTSEVSLVPIDALREKIREENTKARSVARKSLEHVRACGEMLIELKDRCGHGNFRYELHQLKIEQRTANNYMRIASNWKHVSTLNHGVRDALKLLSRADDPPVVPKPPARTPASEIIDVEFVDDVPDTKDDDDAAPLIVDGTGDAIEPAPPDPPAPPHVSHNSGCNEWYTPQDIISRATAVMGGIDTDPASSEIANRTVMAKRIYTIDDDGLTKSWIGNVWLNPPYAQPLIDRFAEKLVSEMTAGNIMSALVLANNATETKWFQRMAASATAVCFPSSRIRFLDPDGKTGQPLQGQAILYFGKHITSFVREFSALGLILKTLTNQDQ